MSDTREEAFVEAIADEDCETILKSVQEEAKTASTLSEECGIPLSTTYRKINCLKEASLVEDKTRVRKGRKPEKVYEQNFEGAVITIGDDGGFDIRFLGPHRDDSPVAQHTQRPRPSMETD